MKKILLQFINCSNLFYNKLNITIKDKDNNIVYNSKTNKYGNITYNFKENEIYKINVLSQNHTIYITKNIKNKIVIYLGNMKLKKHSSITITLTDKYYAGLPMMEGNIYVKRNINTNYKW